MPTDDVSIIDQIRERLRVIEQQFEREMRERGFDPRQADTIPLTPSLATLQDERHELRLQLAALTDKENSHERT